MAKIVSSEAAPSEAVHYTFAGAEFDLGSGKSASFETNDLGVLQAAESHPWLTVEYPEVEMIAGEFREQVKPEDDPLSFVNYKGNDPEVVKADAEARLKAESAQPVAIEAGLDQTKKVVTGDVAETLAAVDTPKTSTKKGDK